MGSASVTQAERLVIDDLLDYLAYFEGVPAPPLPGRPRTGVRVCRGVGSDQAIGTGPAVRRAAPGAAAVAGDDAGPPRPRGRRDQLLPVPPGGRHNCLAHPAQAGLFRAAWGARPRPGPRLKWRYA